MKICKVVGRLVDNFTIEEMCNFLAGEEYELELTPAVVKFAQMMQQLRSWYNKPMTVSSWYRTIAYNLLKGGNPKSPHLRGRAADITFKRKLTNQQILNFIAAWKRICKWNNCVGGVSIYDWGLHFDNNSDCYGLTEFRVNDYRAKK